MHIRIILCYRERVTTLTWFHFFQLFSSDPEIFIIYPSVSEHHPDVIRAAPAVKIYQLICRHPLNSRSYLKIQKVINSGFQHV